MIARFDLLEEDWVPWTADARFLRTVRRFWESAIRNPQSAMGRGRSPRRVYPGGVRRRGTLAVLRDAPASREVRGLAASDTFGLYRFLLGLVGWAMPLGTESPWWQRSSALREEMPLQLTAWTDKGPRTARAQDDMTVDILPD